MRLSTIPSNTYILSTLLTALFIFGLPTTIAAQEYINVPLALYVEDHYTSDIPASISETDTGTSVKIDSSQLLSQLKPFLAEEFHKEIDPIASEKWVTLSQLKDKGIGASYDSSQLSIYLKIPPRMLPPQPIPLRRGRTPVSDYSLSAAPFSAYMNVYAHSDVVYENYDGKSEYRFPAVLNLSPSLNLYNWVLETSSRFYSDREPAVQLDYARLLRDFPEQGIRFAAGTLNTPGEGSLISSIPVDGISVGTLPVLKEVFSSYTPSSRTLMLEQPATVSIYLNGRLLKQLDLKPGVHELIDFPYIGGLNEIKITVTPQGGEEQTVRTLVPFDSGLLDQGQWSYALGAGTPQHSFSDPVASGIIEYGATKNISSGIQLQASLDNYIGTAHSLFATSLGNIDVKAGVSGGVDTPIDFSGRVHYRIYFPSNGQMPTFGAFYHYTGENYLSSAIDPVKRNYRSQFGGSVGQRLPFNSYMNISSTYRIGYQDTENTLNGSLTFLKSMGKNGTFSLSFGVNREGTEELEWQGSLTFSFKGKEANRNLLYSQDLKNGTAGAGYNFSSPDKNSPDYSMSLEGMPPGGSTNSRALIGAAYSHEKFSSSLSQMYAYTPSEAGAETHTVQLSLDFSSALLYTQGKAAVTTPVQDSFVMVAPAPEIEDKLLTARLNRGGAVPGETEGGVIAFPNISSYKPTTIELELPLTPPETVLQENQIELFPAYRSGIVITARLRENVYLEGTLYTLEEKALPLQAGELIQQGVENPEPIYFFTDENGHFQIHDVSPGTYTLRVYSHEQATIEIEIPKGAQNPYQLNRLTMPLGED